MPESYHAPLPPRYVWLRRSYPKLLRILSSMANNSKSHYDNRHMRIIVMANTAEAQYALLMHYYKAAGVINRSPTSHNYIPLKNWETDEIMKLRMQKIPLLHIARKLNRHISTMFYAVRRMKI